MEPLLTLCRWVLVDYDGAERAAVVIGVTDDEAHLRVHLPDGPAGQRSTCGALHQGSERRDFEIVVPRAHADGCGWRYPPRE